MSGGTMNYLYSLVEQADFRLSTPERRAFKAHLAKIAKALHDIEWVDSCDTEPGDEIAAIMACITPSDVLDASIEQAHAAAKELSAVLEKACSGRPL